MATYKISDLLETLLQIQQDGFDYANICELNSAPDEPTSLSFSVDEDEFSSIDYETIDSIDPETIPETYTIKPTDTCYSLLFTYEEINSLSLALANALIYTKECKKDPTLSRDQKDKMKVFSIEWLNLQAKINKFFSSLRH